MQMNKCGKTKIASVLFSFGAGGAAGMLTLKGIRGFSQLTQPLFTPPMVVFLIVWSILLMLLGLGLGDVICRKEQTERREYDAAITAFSVQMTFFFCWMIWFFGLGWYGFSVLWTVGLIISAAVMIRRFYAVCRHCGLLQLPYILWCCFALYLTIGVWWLNR